MATVRVELNEAGFREVRRDPGLRDEMVRVASRTLVPRAKTRAPKRTGYGASTIRAEPLFDGDEWTVHVSWDRSAYYMVFSQFGTRYMPAHPFLMEGS